MSKHYMKASKRKPARREPKSLGEKWAAEIRAQCNKLTPAERERLLERAMQLAYGAKGPTPITPSSR